MTRVAKLITRLSDMGKIIFVVTHDYEFACKVYNRIISFGNGQLQNNIIVTKENIDSATNF